MKTNLLKIYLFSFILFLIFVPKARSEDITVSIPQIAGLSALENGKPVGPIPDMIKDMQKHYKEGKIIIKSIYPFERSIQNVVKGKFDFHFPLIKSPHMDEKKLPYAYVPEPFGIAAFVLYTKTGSKPLDKKNMGKYTIEVRRGHGQLFNFPVEERDDSEASLKKVLLGRIDAYLDAQEPGDADLKKNKFRNIKRELFITFDSYFIVTKSERGKKVKHILNDLIIEMKKDKSLYKHVGKTISVYYKEWQPADMGW